MNLSSMFKPFQPRDLGKVVDAKPKPPAAVDANAEYIRTLEGRLALQCNLTMSLLPVTRHLLSMANIQCRGNDIELTRLAAIGPILDGAEAESRKTLAQVRK